MNYFTPELIEMGRSDDDDILDEQDRLWGEASARYAQYLQEVKEGFPKGLRRLFARYYLHDAIIHRIGQKDRIFLVELQLDTPPHAFLTLRYRLLRPAVVNKESLPRACRSQGPAVEWLYSEIRRLSKEEILGSTYASTWVKDEWLVQAENSATGATSGWPFWGHRVLLSNGWELDLVFHDIAIEEYEDVLLSVTADGKAGTGEAGAPAC
jgi:hypothetical protein